MESLLGAVYLHHGIEVAREVILRLFGALMDTAPTLGAGLDWKTSLQELTAARNLGPPSYLVTSTGPDHDKEFTAVVIVLDTEYGTGVGRSRRKPSRRRRRRRGKRWRRFEARAAAQGHPCLSFPRSRWSGAVCRPTSQARRSPRCG
jgi:dsRNA-specific ribonuclease